jgi:hypothetical protein
LKDGDGLGKKDLSLVDKILLDLDASHYLSAVKKSLRIQLQNINWNCITILSLDISFVLTLCRISIFRHNKSLNEVHFSLPV